MADETQKRQAPPDHGGPKQKRQKQRNWFAGSKDTIKPGDAGIFITCNRGIERRCVGEAKDLFQEYAEKLYGEDDDQAELEDDQEDGDIDAAIKAELSAKPNLEKPPLFENVTLNKECLIFFRTRPPLDPVGFVHTTCSDAASPDPAAPPRHTRFIKRLTPLSYTAPATEAGLESVARKVLAPVFHDEGTTSKTFAIRPTIRDHSKTLTSSGVIKLVAKLVGERHKVNLKEYEALILVEVFKNICGLSVVTDFEKLKRFNLSEIQAPTPKPDLTATAATKASEKPRELDKADGGVGDSA